MAEADPPFMLDLGPAGIVATHPRRLELPVLVAPIPLEDKTAKFNTVRAPLVAVGCMRLFKDGFAFDSSMVAPQSERSFTNFAKLMFTLRKRDELEPKRFPPCSVFGHADPTGDPAYNKTLSGRRARAVFAVLTRNTDIWEELYKSPHGGDEWRHRSLQVMLKHMAFFEGEENGLLDQPTRDAVKAFQESPVGVDDDGNPLKADGDPGKSTRPAIYRAYMDTICHDASGAPFVLDAKTDFIARGKDKSGLKGDVQGCGELNPIFLFSEDDEKTFKKDPLLAKSVRDPLYVVNRRVVVYIFRHGTEVDLKTWPCPRTKEGDGKCIDRAWSDHKKRSNAGPVQREFGENMTVLDVDDAGALTEHPVEETGNTMGCRFYHAFAVHSPCEAKIREWVVRFRIDAPKGMRPVANRRYVVQAGDAQYSAMIRGTTDDKGEVRIPLLGEKTTMFLKLDVHGKEQKSKEEAASQAEAPPGNDAAPAAEASPSDEAAKSGKVSEGFDTDRFPDEDDFSLFVLDAGKLKPADVADDLAIKQRLYNLGFGKRAPAEWTESELDVAFRQYRHLRGLDKADAPTVRARIINEHDREDPTPPPEDQAPPPAAAE